MPLNTKKQPRKKNSVAVLVVGLFLVGVLVFIYVQRIKSVPENTASSNEIQNQNPTIAPATDQEKAETEQHKKDLIKQSEQQNDNQTGMKSVTPLITYVDKVGENYEIAAFVPGIAEDNGTCTLSATQESATISRSLTANRSASTTDCPLFVVASKDFTTAGIWDLKVQYKSASSEGISSSWQLTVK